MSRMRDATPVLVVHGTRRPAGVRTAERIAARLAERIGRPVPVAYADVRGPRLSDVLAQVTGPAVVLPAFLAAGYHVRTDLPAQLAATGHDAVLAAPLGPDPAVLAALADRAGAAGWRPGDALVLAAAGSRDPSATADVRHAAARLAARLDTAVPVGHVTAAPPVADVVAAHGCTGRRVVVAAYLLAPGLFHDRLAGAGADAVAAPLGCHPGIVAALHDRYRAASGRAPAHAA
jgi:sirohydrochlorin ferrochelatase